ncbi:hypothetical protein ACHOLT_13275 [Desulfitobacterium sp. Sab5]|uniref:hypothetical protein n=1 Tax=Desulfitobacterium nosdiversum TaxID=3375356 RepID=UPI003CF0E0BB
MKVKKKTAMLISFALGSLIFATTAMADITSKSGYEQFKDSIKTTAEKCSSTFDSYTTDISYVLKDNGNNLVSDNTIQKLNRANKSHETTSIRESLSGGKFTQLFYFDPMTRINQNSGDPTYYVTEFSEPQQDYSYKNPFKEERAADAEKIADAIIGSLKDQVILSNNADGSKDFKGSLNEVQIPTLINALVSFQLKQNFNGNNPDTPSLAKDIFVKEITGSAHVNPEGYLENILGTATIEGKDSQGKEHEITIEVLAKLSGINTTAVNKPDLTGQKVNKQVGKNQGEPQKISNYNKFVGKYSNPIIAEKDGKYVKLGKRVLEIQQIDETHLLGKYYEEYKAGNDPSSGKSQSFSFDAAFNSGDKNDPRGLHFETTGESGEKIIGNMHLDENLGKIYFDFNRIQGNFTYDSSFSPDLD